MNHIPLSDLSTEMTPYKYKSRFVYFLALLPALIVAVISVYLLFETVQGADGIIGWVTEDGRIFINILIVVAFLMPLINVCLSVLFYTRKYYIAASLILLLTLVAPIGYYAEISIISSLIGLIAAASYSFELRRHPVNRGVNA